MAFITEYQHKVLLVMLDQSIRMFEQQQPADRTSKEIVKNLKKEKKKLQEFYQACNTKREQLKNLLSSYKISERKAQREMRICRLKYKKNAAA
ncbi:hypothetical protein [Ferruginibacter sp.]